MSFFYEVEKLITDHAEKMNVTPDELGAIRLDELFPPEIGQPPPTQYYGVPFGAHIVHNRFKDNDCYGSQIKRRWPPTPLR